MSSDKEDSELLSKYIDMDSWAQKNIIEELISEAIKNEEIIKVTNDKSTEFNNVL